VESPSAGNLCPLQGVVPAADRVEFWDQHKNEFAVCVTNLPDEVNSW
jgi:hypothetical protein